MKVINIYLTLLTLLHLTTSILGLIENALPFLLAQVRCICIFDRVVNDFDLIEKLVLLVATTWGS